MLFAIFVSVLAMVAAHIDYSGRPTIKDVEKLEALFSTFRQFHQGVKWAQRVLIDTHGEGTKIYLVMRSYNVKKWGKENTCLYSKVESYNDKTLTMRQAYTPRGLKGLIYPVTMKVSWSGGTDVAPRLNASTYVDSAYMRVYRFHYHDRNSHCAVITFTDDSGTIRCELHTWKSYSTAKDYAKCKEEYEYQCAGRKIYYPDLSNCPNLP